MEAIKNTNPLEKAVRIIKEFEVCSLTASLSPAGVWMIGYGETQGVSEGDVWTQEKADSMISQRVQAFMGQLLEKCPQLADESPGRLAACVSLAYEIGIGAFIRSSVYRDTSRKNYEKAADAFLFWKSTSAFPLAGVAGARASPQRKREAERALYMEIT